ncbi:MAG: hypothetical protein KAI47_17935 [Deltaproteobacteria bacterium]|nr:hypothetical protein [Deltaproteobacteria bacterium]
MGLFGKMKSFFGGGGVKVEVTDVEDPFPMGDSVIKGNYVVTAGPEEKVLLSCKTWFIAKGKDKDDDEFEIELHDDPDDTADLIDEDNPFPLTLKPEDTYEGGFCIIEVEIKKRLKRKHVSLDDVKFYVKVEADVKGTPFDPEATKKVHVVK